MSETEDVLFDLRGGVGFIALNRPKALNALTLPMIRAIGPQLAAWQEDARVHAVVVRGIGERAFCAGGDVRAVWLAGRSGDPLARKRVASGKSVAVRVDLGGRRIFIKKT